MTRFIPLDDHYVTRPDEYGDRREDRLRRAGGDCDLAVDIEMRPIRAGDLVDDSLVQPGHTGHRRVRVTPGQHVTVHGIEQSRFGLEISKALRQVDRPALGRQARHRQPSLLRQLPGSDDVADPAFDVTPGWLIKAVITERGACPASTNGLAILLSGGRP